MAHVHVSPYAGSWYPSRREALEALLDESFAASAARTSGYLLPGALAFVAPHAGIPYSGVVAASVYRHLARQKPSRVVLIGFAHHGGPPGVVIPDVDAIRTPLGEVRVTRPAPFERVPEPEVCDHSVEIQLPLLQRVAPEAEILPLYAGRMSEAQADSAAQRLARLAEPGTVFVASSDFTHYGRGFRYQPFPLDDETARRLWQLDADTIEAASSLEADLFSRSLCESGSTVCGRVPIALLLRTLRLAGRAEVFQQLLDYQTSGDITGDYSHSVSYAALGYFPEDSFHLTPEEMALLAGSARATLDRLLATGERHPVPPSAVTPAMTRRAGAFVSLREGQRLRGCVGFAEGATPLSQAIPRLTLSAALDDPRFAPLRRGDGDVDIEISVLTPLKRAADPDRFLLGQHGACIDAGDRHALLLPQVAGERAWTTPAFLDALCLKAGLPAGSCGQPGVKLFLFRAQLS